MKIDIGLGIYILSFSIILLLHGAFYLHIYYELNPNVQLGLYQTKQELINPFQQVPDTIKVLKIKGDYFQFCFMKGGKETQIIFDDKKCWIRIWEKID